MLTLLISNVGVGIASDNNTIPASLTLIEKQWIKDHPVILYAPDPDFPPVEYFDENNKVKGLASDYIDIIFKQVGLRKKVVKFNNWLEVLSGIKNKKIDLIVACPSQQRDKYLVFSKSFVNFPAVIIVRHQVKQELTLEQLSGMKIGVVNNYASHDYIAANYPYLDLALVPNIETGLRKVSFGMVDAMVANIAIASHYIEKSSITNLKVTGESGFNYRLAFAPRRDIPILASIINKGLDSLTQAKKKSILNKWVHLQDAHATSKTTFLILAVCLVIIFLIIAVFMGWNRFLRATVAKKTKELKHEIVKHENAKQKAVENEIRYKGIFENTTTGVIVYKVIDDCKNFIALDLNQSACGIDKLRHSEIIGKSIFDIFPGIHEFGLIKIMQSVWETGIPAHLPSRFYCDERIEGWRDYFVHKLPSNEIVTVYSDETSRIMAETALMQSEEKLSGIIRSINDHMVLLDDSLNILWANHTSKLVFGDDIENQKCYAVFAKLKEACEDCIAKKCFAQGQKQEREFNVKTNEENTYVFWESANIASFDHKRQPKTVVTIFRDITKREALAAEAMRAGHLASIGELAAGVAHEINNPINSIINLAQLISNENEKKDDENEMALRIINEGKRIADIVSSLLAFAKEKKGHEVWVNILDVVMETLTLTKAHLDKYGIIIEMDIPYNLPMIHCHMQKLQQVFLNLINNARYALTQKITKNKILKIKGEAITLNDLHFIRIVFEDNGTGIPDTIIDRVMDPFFSTKPDNSGTGLGLSISHGIVSNHGGDMKILSKENQYTKVIIDLPSGGKS